MPRTKKTTLPPLSAEDVTLNTGYVSDMGVSTRHGTRTDRKLADELMSKFDPTAVVDAYEESIGLKPKGANKAPKYFYRPTILEPEQPADKEKLTNLMNDPKYKIIVYKDSFSVRGDYKVFIIYGELVDETKPKET